MIVANCERCNSHMPFGLVAIVIPHECQDLAERTGPHRHFIFGLVRDDQAEVGKLLFESLDPLMLESLPFDEAQYGVMIRIDIQ